MPPGHKATQAHKVIRGLEIQEPLDQLVIQELKVTLALELLELPARKAIPELV